MTDEEVRKHLTAEDEEYRAWSQEHRQHEARLAQLTVKRVLTADEELEEKQLKKRKLFLKDQMAAKLRTLEAVRT